MVPFVDEKRFWKLGNIHFLHLATLLYSPGTHLVATIFLVTDAYTQLYGRLHTTYLALS